MMCLLLRLSLCAVVLPVAISAQTVSPQTVVVNDELLRHVQMLNPAFHYSPESVILTGSLRKHLLVHLLNADSPEADSLRNLPEFASQRDRYLQLADAVFWSSLVAALPEKGRIPAEKEVQDFYHRNKEQFREPYRFSYWQAFIETPSPAITDNAKKELQRLAAEARSGESRPKVSGEGFMVNHEAGLRLGADHPLFDELAAAVVGNVVGPVAVGSSLVYLMLTGRTGGDISPYEQVREACLQGLLAERALSEGNGRNALIDARFRVVLPY